MFLREPVVAISTQPSRKDETVGIGKMDGGRFALVLCLGWAWRQGACVLSHAEGWGRLPHAATGKREQ